MNNKLKLGILSLIALFYSNQSIAQMIDIGETINKQGNSFISAFPVIAIVILIVIVIWRSSDFTDKNGDWKKGLAYIIGYIVLVSIVLGVASAFRGMSI